MNYSREQEYRGLANRKTVDDIQAHYFISVIILLLGTDFSSASSMSLPYTPHLHISYRNDAKESFNWTYPRRRYSITVSYTEILS